MRGARVIVRSYGGTPLVRRVWDADANGVYISSESEFQKLTSGKEGLLPVGFPREDVFEFDQEAAARAERAYNPDEWDWSRLTRWEGVDA